jgi:prepilin-type processing-associated H-X9-DG protein
MEGPTNGAFFQCGSLGVTFEQITDGLSNTLLAGEKHVPLGKFGYGGWDNCYYDGDYVSSCTRAAGPANPLVRTLTSTSLAFGSYHPSICQFAFCDGSVRPIAVSINSVTLGLLADRCDGQAIQEY